MKAKEHKIIITNDSRKTDQLIATWDKGNQSAIFNSVKAVKDYFIGLFWNPVFIDKVDYTINFRSFSECVDRLGIASEKTCYFTPEFYWKYRKAYQTASKNRNAGNLDTYKKNNIILCHEFDEIYNDDFYIKNSCAYCYFLEIING